MSQQLKQELPAFEINSTPCQESCVRNIDFNHIFAQAVDSAFSMLGEQAKQTLFRYLHRNLDLEKENIGNNVEALALVIEAFFGQSARLIEVRIIKVLHASVPDFKYVSKDNELSFVKYVEALRKFV